MDLLNSRDVVVAVWAPKQNVVLNPKLPIGKGRQFLRFPPFLSCGGTSLHPTGVLRSYSNYR